MNRSSPRLREAVIATILFGIGGLLLLPRDAPTSAPRPPKVSLVSHHSSHSVDGVDFIPIKSIRVGQRVWVAEEAPGDGDLEFGEDVIAAQWRKMVLRCPKRDGSTAHVEMLRPAWWLAERDVAAGGTVDIDVPECGISGRADVLAVEACPPSAPGPGRVVTSTFHHQAAATIDITIEGMEEPIGSTPNHPIWSETEQQFVRADALRPGEQVRTLAGLAQVVAITPRGPPEPVYNLEVQVDHVFHVGTSGVLVHNNLPIVNGSCFALTEQLLKKLRNKGVSDAWKAEADLVRRTGQGTRRWTAAEKAELLERGRVRGYQGHHINSVNGHPELAAEPSNIEFVTRRENLLRHLGNWRNPTTGPLIPR